MPFLSPNDEGVQIALEPAYHPFTEMKPSNKLFITSFILFTLAIGCAAVYNIKGNYIDAEGILHESFGFIPFGYLFVFSGIITAIFGVIKRAKNK